MVAIENEIALSAPPGAVWRALTDFERYTAWHPVVRLQGTAELGSVLDYSLVKTVSYGFTAAARARITRLEPDRTLQWQFGIPLLFRFTETYSLTPRQAGTALVHRIEFRGLGVVLPRKRFLARSQDMACKANEGLARYLDARKSPRCQG